MEQGHLLRGEQLKIKHLRIQSAYPWPGALRPTCLLILMCPRRLISPGAGEINVRFNETLANTSGAALGTLLRWPRCFELGSTRPQHINGNPEYPTAPWTLPQETHAAGYLGRCPETAGQTFRESKEEENAVLES